MNIAFEKQIFYEQSFNPKRRSGLGQAEFKTFKPAIVLNIGIWIAEIIFAVFIIIKRLLLITFTTC